jgi:undecaprenyl diphosphate synthase
MDGNGRWAEARGLPRAAGHREGVRALRTLVEHCVRRRVPALTVFAFSSENWKRPRPEVALLMDLFLSALAEHVDALHANGVKVRFIGDRTGFSGSLREAIRQAETKTAANAALKLVVAADYGGRWDMARACRDIAAQALTGELDAGEIDEALVGRHMSLAGLPDPDLFIRTGGERRVSNFLLWELAYSELYFTDELWPDFSPASLDAAIRWYSQRERRFGKTSGQVGRVQGG